MTKEILLCAEWSSIRIKNGDSFSAPEVEMSLDFDDAGVRVTKIYLFSGVADLKIDELLLNKSVYIRIKDISNFWLEGLNWEVVGFEMDNPISFRCTSFRIL